VNAESAPWRSVQSRKIRNPQIRNSIANPQSTIPIANPQSTIPIANPQSQSEIDSLKIGNLQSEFRNRPLSQTLLSERCISVSASGLLATYPSTHPIKETAIEDPSVTVSSLFDLHANGVYRLALAMLREPEAAQDVVQDTFARLIEQLRVHGPLTNPRGWLYTVAAHACRDRQRRLGRWLPWISERDTRTASDTPDRLDGTQSVLDAIRALSSRDRLLVALRAQGLSYREIADAAAIRSASVGRLLTRALNRLQRELDRRR